MRGDAVRLRPAEAVAPAAFSASQVHPDKLVWSQDRYAGGFAEFLDGNIDMPPAAIAAKPKPLALLRGRFQSYKAPRVRVIVGHVASVERNGNICNWRSCCWGALADITHSEGSDRIGPLAALLLRNEPLLQTQASSRQPLKQRLLLALVLPLRRQVPSSNK